jgi:MarR family 2-MHQ and catechol resistance regulon transcriptional repressor
MEALLHKGPLPINTIGEKVLLTSGSMTAAINRLEKKGFVRRIQDRSDGRFFHVHLTEIGRMVIKKAYQKHATNLEQVAAGLNQGERQELLDLLKKIGRHAEQVHIDNTS